MASLVLAVLIMICSAVAVYMATAWPLKAKLFPLVIGIPVFCLAAAEALWALFGSTASRGAAMDFQLSEHVPPKAALVRTLGATGWMIGFFAAIVLLGFHIAIPLFVFSYLKVQGRERWALCVAVTVAAWGFFYGIFDRLLHLPLPAGWIQTWMGA
jgi:hypothetical protein